MVVTLAAYFETDCYMYGPNDVPPPADYYENRRVLPLRAAKYYGPNFIPGRHAWSDFHVDHFREHLGPRLLQIPCPDPPIYPFRPIRSVRDAREVLQTAILEPVNLALQAVFLPPFVSLLYSSTFWNERRKSLEVYRTIRPTHIMWDDLYETLPDDCTVPDWSQLSIEEKGKALVDLLPLITHHMPNGHGINLETHEWDQAIPFDARQCSDPTRAGHRVPGALRYLAYLDRRSGALLRMAKQAVEEKDYELIAYFIQNITPSDEIIPYLAPYMSTDNIAQTTQELKDAFANGQLRKTLSILEPTWDRFCHAKTDTEALIQIFMQLPPAFPALLPEHSELRSDNHDRVIITAGYRASCIPGFLPGGACISAENVILEVSERINRVPGEISFTWDIDVLRDPNLENPVTLSAVSKAYTYSNQHNARYGYLLTEGCLLVFRRCEKEPGIPRNGHIEISKIFWVGLNASFALFYLHLLASHLAKWKLPSNLWSGSSRLFDIHDNTSFNNQ